MTTQHDTTVGFGFAVTLTGHAKRDSELHSDPEDRIEEILTSALGWERFREGLLIVASGNAFTGDDCEGRVAVLLKGERGKKHLIGGFGSFGHVSTTEDVAQPKERDKDILDDAVDALRKHLGRKIKKIDCVKDYGWHVVTCVY